MVKLSTRRTRLPQQVRMLVVLYQMKLIQTLYCRLIHTKTLGIVSNRLGLRGQVPGCCLLWVQLLIRSQLNRSSARAEGEKYQQLRWVSGRNRQESNALIAHVIIFSQGAYGQQILADAKAWVK